MSASTHSSAVRLQKDQLDLGLRDTICKLEERPWPRVREVGGEPAWLVAWLSTELTDPMDTIETDLLWLLPCPLALFCWVSGGCEVGIHGMEPARLRVVLPGETFSEELGRWPRRALEVGVDGGGARRPEGWETAARC